MKNWAKVGCEALVIIFLAVASGTLLNLPLIRDFYQGKLPPQFIEQKDYPRLLARRSTSILYRLPFAPIL